MSIEEIINHLDILACVGEGAEEDGRVRDINGANAAALQQAIAFLKTHPEAQPNEPLTLEELREMEGHPVWISPVKENGKVLARWMLVSGYNPKKDIYLFTPSSNITQGYDGKSYGKTWLASRRPPKED